MRKLGYGLGCLALMGAASTSFGAVGVVVSEDFESYANDGDMLAAWALGQGTVNGSLETTFGSDGLGNSDSGQSAFHDGSGANVMDFATLVPTETEWIHLQVDIFDDDTSQDPFFPLNPSNKRMSLGLRDSAGANLIELGMYNSGDQYAYRAILFGDTSDDPNWAGWDLGTETIDVGDPPVPTEFPVNRYRGEVWNTWHVTITPDTLIFEFDLGADGTIDATDTYDTGVETGASGYNQIRFGGPSGISSLGGGVHFDNILLEVIEAPAPGLEGDLNSDGFVGVDDLNIVLVNWNQNVTAGELTSGDPTGDGFVGVDDLNTVLVNWNNGTPPAGGAAVPEPASLALLGLGGAAMLRRRR